MVCSEGEPELKRRARLDSKAREVNDIFVKILLRWTKANVVVLRGGGLSIVYVLYLYMYTET